MGETSGFFTSAVSNTGEKKSRPLVENHRAGARCRAWLLCLNLCVVLLTACLGESTRRPTAACSQTGQCQQAQRSRSRLGDKCHIQRLGIRCCGDGVKIVGRIDNAAIK